MTRILMIFVTCLAMMVGDAQAQSTAATPQEAPDSTPGASVVVSDTALGPVTNLPMPRYVSMKTGEGNVRRGPSLEHRIDWVFQHRNMPLRITAEYGHWRRVQDRDGVGGWVHYSLLSGTRTVIVEQDMQPVLGTPQEGAPVVAHLELGVIAHLGECLPEWCRITAQGYRGWVLKSALWGVEPDELRD